MQPSRRFTRRKIVARSLLSPLLAIACLLAGATAHAAGAPSACHYREGSVLSLTQPAGGTPMVDGSINQQPVRMLLDTGAGRTSLIRSTADRLGLTLTRENQFSYGIGGRASIYSARVRDLGLGNLHSRVTLLPVLDSLPNSAAGVLLGADFLFQADLEVALAEKQVRFFHADGCDDRFLAYWDPHASEMPLERSSSASAWPTIEILLNGIKVRAIIDTGAVRSLIDLDAASRAGITPDTPGVVPSRPIHGIGSAAMPVWNAQFATFTIGDETIQHAKIGIVDLQQGRPRDAFPDMLIGRDFLLAHRVLFALSQDRLYFSYLGGPVFNDALPPALMMVPAPGATAH
jgi:hypothetical protein